MESDDVVAGATTYGIVARAIRVVRRALDAKAKLALRGELGECWLRILNNPPGGMSARQGASQ